VAEVAGKRRLEVNQKLNVQGFVQSHLGAHHSEVFRRGAVLTRDDQYGIPGSHMNDNEIKDDNSYQKRCGLQDPSDREAKQAHTSGFHVSWRWRTEERIIAGPEAKRAYCQSLSGAASAKTPYPPFE
jgi:hypothetical protein